MHLNGQRLERLGFHSSVSTRPVNWKFDFVPLADFDWLSIYQSTLFYRYPIIHDQKLRSDPNDKKESIEHVNSFERVYYQTKVELREWVACTQGARTSAFCSLQS